MVATLTVWEGDYGVASVDINCLILVTYIKMAKINCNIVYVKNPLFKSMPCLSIEQETINPTLYGFDDIWKYIRTLIFDTDHFMQDEQKSESVAYHKLITNNLLPAISYTLWVDQQNYIEVTRKWYRKALSFPINFFYPYYKYNQVLNYVEALTPGENIEENSFRLIDAAKLCITDLSNKLGTKQYFFGDTPSSLDAIIFGYIAPFMNIPIPVSPLQAFLKEQTNLVKFVKRINMAYFAAQKVEYKYVEKISHEEELQEFTTPPKTLALAAFCVTAAMISYGIMNGIIKLPSNHS